MTVYETLDNGIKIVEYEPALAATLADMWNKSRDDWGGGNDVKTPGQVATRIEGSSIIHHYVAMDGDEAVGYCSLGRYWADADALYIELLGVRPDYQGKKVGKALTLQAVNRTIALGYPRVDIHTWAGNTAAVPLYKKCGYLWEDRPDSTHLVNFIPEILATELFKPFFAKADWYTDATRSWDIVPDEAKENKFGVFGYSWEKDGEKIAVGYERTGRRIRLVETNDYKIELMAQNHELAFGLHYNCSFTVTNKSGKDLHIKINGREDANIKFDFALDEKITATQVFDSTFFVGEITEIQNKWKVHPCLLADVVINGQSVTMGLGICAKYPLTVDMGCKNQVPQIGLTTDVYVNIHSALLQDAEISFSIPKHTLADLKNDDFKASIKAEDRTAIPTVVTYRAMGYEALPITYDIKLADGTAVSFTKPLHLFNQDFTHAFGGKDEKSHYIVNGPWKVSLDNTDNMAWISHLTNPHFSKGWLDLPKFGKPYDEEFNLIRPTVRFFAEGSNMVMEAELVSEKFEGLVATMVITLSASGIITRHYRVENRGKTAREAFFNDSYWLALGQHTTFRYNGQFTQNHDTPRTDGPHYGIDALDPDLFEENWIFEANPAGGRGFCWPPDVKPGFQWGNMAIFETDLKQINPGQTVETPKITHAYGLFTEFSAFRNYALGLWDKNNYVPYRRVEVRLNGYNPFVTEQEVALDVVNNRETLLAGDICVSSDLFETQVQTNENDDDDDDDDDENGAEIDEDDDDENDAVTKENNFTLAFNNPPAVSQLCVDMNLATYEKSYHRVLFAPRGEVSQKKDGTNLTVTNGAITFCADATYGSVCYSLKIADGAEWLLNQYPEHKPFAWFNPFLGGIRVIPEHMNNVALLKEEIAADFTEVKDNFGNVWRGIRTTLTFKEDDQLKGGTFETYFVTLPGLPLLCAFFRFVNNTGVFKNFVPEFDAFLQPVDGEVPFKVEITDKHGVSQNLQYGAGADMEVDFENTAKIIGPRPQKLYLFHGNKNNGKTNEISGDVKYPLGLDTYMECTAAPGETFTGSPVFYLMTEVDLPAGALDDLERVKFDA